MGGSDCELLGGGWLAQPVNALSSLAYVVAAAVVLVTRWRARATGPAAWIGAGALTVCGIGSFAFHGPQPSWAERLHDLGALAVVVAVVVQVMRARSLPVAALGTTGAAMALYVVGRSGGLLCAPTSIFQPHAGWHVLTAAAAASTFVQGSWLRSTLPSALRGSSARRRHSRGTL